jgi:glycosyltransferase involved in cell wall biosynthesis
MEGISLAIQESMAAGLPVVSTHAGALAEFLRHGIDSIVVEGADPTAFADAVEQLASSRELRLRIGRAGQQKVARLGNEAWVDAVADIVKADLRS